MQSELKIENVVLVGNFNPSRFDKYFFISNNIFSNDDILNTSKFETLHVNLNTINFNVIVLNQQIIIHINPETQKEDFTDLLIKFISTNEIEQISAMGFNLHFYNFLSKESFREVTKNYFYSKNIKVFSEHFDTDDSFYGVYASKTLKDARLKLDIKPTVISDIENLLNLKYILAFVFNFHFDIKENGGKSELLRFLKDYNTYKKEAVTIVSVYN